MALTAVFFIMLIVGIIGSAWGTHIYISEEIKPELEKNEKIIEVIVDKKEK